ncbi:MBL fold metallo-hydrolase [Actinospica durhamensis]|uniref:MBL fold metallo-hydrolase n=1 Tax=Actinospica durhamensis TaxID=1508375 RepID=A0A941EWI0_9ACTN|nr:MBL fold metallo-hydrolase [Actinospica durhamensis]MBR7838583.1 MBL fold metallo-hydrolase [Actinospica durhamensis]
MSKPAALCVAPNLWRIPVAPFSFVNVYAFVEDDGQVTLVDTGMKSSAKRIEAGLALMGKSVADVTRIVLTHAHADHAGGAAGLLERTGVPGVAIHQTDAPFARDGHAPPRDTSTFLGRLANRGSNAFPAVVVAEEFVDGDVLPVAGGLSVHHTPGHTAGHVSLLHQPTGVLVTGDAIWNVRKLSYGVKAFCQDVKLNERSAHVLGELEYTVAAFTHGPHVSDQAREAVRGYLRDADARQR